MFLVLHTVLHIVQLIVPRLKLYGIVQDSLNVRATAFKRLWG